MHVCVELARAQVLSAPLKRRWRCGLIASLMLLTSGCLSTVDRGDHAFEQGRYEEALTLYEQGIDQGQTRDPQVYYRAAVAATDRTGAPETAAGAAGEGAETVTLITGDTVQLTTGPDGRPPGTRTRTCSSAVCATWIEPGPNRYGVPHRSSAGMSVA